MNGFVIRFHPITVETNFGAAENHLLHFLRLCVDQMNPQVKA